MRIIGHSVSGLLGGSLSGVTVLDMACNWGGMALEMRARNARVSAFDLRAINIEKAKSLSHYLGYRDIEFFISNVYELDSSVKYDVVLNLGLLYHVTRSYELIKKTYEICNKFAIVETVTHHEPFSGFTLGWHGGPEHSSGEERAEIHPTYRGLIDMMLMVGFREVQELDGEPDPQWSDYAATAFGRKNRRFLLGIR